MHIIFKKYITIKTKIKHRKKNINFDYREIANFDI